MDNVALFDEMPVPEPAEVSQRETGGEEPQPPIDPMLTEEALDKLKIALDRDLQAAKGSKVDIDARVKRFRGYHALDRPTQQYEGQPNHVVPYVRAKVAGATAHYRGALDQDPFFVVRPYTEEAAQNQGPWETMMERELDRSGTRRHLFAAIQEACLTGTGILQLSVSKPFDEFMIQARAVRIEDFFVAPAGVDDISQCSTFLYYREPWHVVRRKVEDREYDAEQAERVRTHANLTKQSYDEDKEGTGGQTFQEDNQPKELYECYYRWGDEELGIEHTLWRVIFHEGSSTILYANESDFIDAFDAPPYVPIRPMPRIGFFYGESYAQVLEGVQNMMDFALNAKLAYDQLAISPIVFVDQDSEVFDLIKNKGLAPGDIVPTRGDPNASVYVVPLPSHKEPLELLQTVRSLGEDATFNDLQLNGIPTSTVRSATEVNALTNAATKKLAEDLSNISHDLSTFARMYWALIYSYKIEDKGVVPIFHGSEQYLIAGTEVPQNELQDRLMEFMQQRMGVMLPPEAQEAAMQQVTAQLDAAGIELFISSAKRDDLEWYPNGSQLIPDKALRAQKLERLFGTYFPVFQLVHQSRAAWHMLREYLRSLDIHNWRDLMPAKPPEQDDADLDPRQVQQFTEQLNLLRRGGE